MSAPMRPKLFNRTDSDSTEAPEHSDADTARSVCSSASPSPRAHVRSEGACNVVVRSTFLDVAEDEGLMGCFRQLRGRTMSDSALVVAFGGEEAYIPGKFSKEHASPLIVSQAPKDDCRVQPMAVQPKAKPSHKKKTQLAKQVDRTTVMLRNLPNNYTREMFLALLDNQGFAGRYDFVYLPCDFRRQANLGYAFVNLVDASAVDAAWATFDGFASWSLPSHKVCQVKWSGPHQGFEAHVERFRNSPVMHKSVPAEYKPVIFKDGVRKNFPKPTKKIKAPSMAA
ncbi:ML3 [Symbiodinium pilosum]|uniref:ML3 protein n=1 Tax=Symbiodinium pilosum TaxID=2952 RepID=A0A812JWM9_SYMPI|nr:ML3 [Symbiodinium pilosum]